MFSCVTISDAAPDSFNNPQYALLRIVDIRVPFYFVADAYYASQKIINGLLEQDHHLVTRVRSYSTVVRNRNPLVFVPADGTTINSLEVFKLVGLERSRRKLGCGTGNGITPIQL